MFSNYFRHLRSAGYLGKYYWYIDGFSMDCERDWVLCGGARMLLEAYYNFRHIFKCCSAPRRCADEVVPGICATALWNFIKFENPRSGRAGRSAESGSCKITGRYFFFLIQKWLLQGSGRAVRGEANQCINYTSAGEQKLIFIVIQMMATLAP